jgi:DNA-binding response OmpR family regulator
VPAPNLPDFSGLLVLVVEDDADSREFLRAVLERCGARVIEADNVRTARLYIETLKIDLIVTDLALPHEDGAALLKWLRALPAEKGGTIPAIAVTAYYENYPPAQLSGWAAYFQKPLHIEQLVNTIGAILGRGGKMDREQ